jgi:glycosyltransferase involved in cell wall biosynthesis
MKAMNFLLTMNLPYMRVHGGANRSNRYLAEKLVERGHSVRAVVPVFSVPARKTREELVNELVNQGIRVVSNSEVDCYQCNGVEVHAVVNPSHLRAYLTEQIGKTDPDWILVSSEDPSQSLLDAALKITPSRIVYLAHTPQMFPFGPASLFPGKQRTQLIGRVAAIVTISRFVADYIKRWAGLDSFVNHPPHYGSGPFPNFDRYDTGYVCMLNASAIKGLSVFLHLARLFPQVRFAALTGYGTTMSDRLALDQLPNITVLKNEPNLDDILNKVRILLMPSLWVEGFGMAVVDAMLRGIPVLASNFGGLVEAKLGTNLLLPVEPIVRFEDRFDDNMLPVPIVPDQEIGPWYDALSPLLSDRSLYIRESQTARAAAMQFNSSLSIVPLEDMLLDLKSKMRAVV